MAQADEEWAVKQDKEAADRYETFKEIRNEGLLALKRTDVPTEAGLSFGLLNLAPVLGGAALLAGYGGSICCDPMLARSLLRFTGMTIALNGGIHFGLGASFYETERNAEIT